MAYDEVLAARVRAALSGPGAGEMDFTGRPMRGLVMVRAEQLATDEALDDWLVRAVSYAQSEPPKAPRGARLPRTT